MFFIQWRWARVSNLTKATLVQTFRTKSFFNLKFKSFVVMLENFCQRLELDNILLRLHIITKYQYDKTAIILHLHSNLLSFNFRLTNFEVVFNAF